MIFLCLARQILAIPLLVQLIQTRLSSKAQQMVRYQTFETWEELRDLLKSNLEP